MVTPQPHQATAVLKIEHNAQSVFKGILIADPPGLGKTLMSMIAVVRAIATARRFSVVVVPSSCVEQWESEFQKFFVPVSLHIPNKLPNKTLTEMHVGYYPGPSPTRPSKSPS